MALESLKQFSEFSNNSRQSQTVFAVLNSSQLLPVRFIISCYFRWLSLTVAKLASKVGQIFTLFYLFILFTLYLPLTKKNEQNLQNIVYNIQSYMTANNANYQLKNKN